jgi:hypothetical protein
VVTRREAHDGAKGARATGGGARRVVAATVAGRGWSCGAQAAARAPAASEATWMHRHAACEVSRQRDRIRMVEAMR